MPGEEQGEKKKTAFYSVAKGFFTGVFETVEMYDRATNG